MKSGGTTASSAETPNAAAGDLSKTGEMETKRRPPPGLPARRQRLRRGIEHPGPRHAREDRRGEEEREQEVC